MKLDSGSNIVNWTIIGAVIVAIIVIVCGFFTGGDPQAEAADIVPAGVKIASRSIVAADNAMSTRFISDCSMMNLTDPSVRLYAASECSGRIRGFVDGHNLTVAMAAKASGTAGGNALRLFCVSPDVESDKLMTDIMDWVDANPAEYDAAANADTRDIATIVMIKALRATYPCANT